MVRIVAMSSRNLIKTSVAWIETLCSDVKRIRIFPVYQKTLPEFEPGSNIEVSVLGREGDIPTPYSIVSSPANTASYDFIVAGSRAERSSKNDWLLDHLQVGDMLDISEPRKGLEFAGDADGYFIAGGSGITAFLSHFNSVNLNSKSYHLCHIVRERDRSFFGLDHESINYIDTCQVVTSEDTTFEIDSFFGDKKPNAPVHVSGSRRLIKDVIAKAKERGWSPQDIYWDKYALPECGSYDSNSGRCC